MVFSSVFDNILPNSRSILTNLESDKSTNYTAYRNCDVNNYLKLSWMGDYESFKQFIEANTFTEGIWRSPGDERKTYSNGNTTITWWKKKKKMEFSGKDADEIKLQLCNVLIPNLLC